MLNGRHPRTKSAEQFLSEIDRIYAMGWRGDISVVDDNFIGNRKKLKSEVLPAVIKWQKAHKYPIKFITEVSINLAEDDELIHLMTEAGFTSIFVGIETPNDESLNECGKTQNQRRDLISSVKKLQNCGMIVSGGFIVGFDNDTTDIFDQQIRFIQQSGIVSAMVGLLNAPRGTKLYKRLEKENRILDSWSGNNMDGATNFIPKMNYKDLIKGYSHIISTIYSHKEYYLRLRTFIKEYNNPKWLSNRISWTEFKAFIKLVWLIGIIEKGKKEFWNFLFFSVFRHPDKFPLAMTLTVYGYHFRRIAATL
jgi:radical SAM superfamily enzyme YgiQ (UPF0313 family)